MKRSKKEEKNIVDLPLGWYYLLYNKFSKAVDWDL